MFSRILFVCHKVFFHQVNSWLVHGQLIDLTDEFFIHKVESTSARDGGSADDKSTQLNATSASGLSANVGAAGMNVVSTILAMNQEKNEEDSMAEDWNSLFTLRLSMLPTSYIPATLGQKILFIGKAVKVLQSNKTPPEDRIPPSELQCFSEAIMQLENLPEFNTLLVSKVVEEIRECIASRLWHLIVLRSNLMEDLRAAKDYFLLAKGEFYQTFLEEARSLMALAPTSTVEYDLNAGPLHQTIVKLGLEDDKMLKKFKMTLRSFSFTYNNFSSLNGLCVIGNVDVTSNTHSYKIMSHKNSVKSGALWHSLKQRIENGFATNFGFRFYNSVFHMGPQGSQLNQSMVSNSWLNQSEMPREATNMTMANAL